MNYGNSPTAGSVLMAVIIIPMKCLLGDYSPVRNIITLRILFYGSNAYG